jgi:hypothetical protein
MTQDQRRVVISAIIVIGILLAIALYGYLAGVWETPA